MSAISYASFWHGKAPSPYELACMSSFVFQGYDFILYSYDRIENLPCGVKNVDAREILPPDLLKSFIVTGSASVAHFSDYFRYKMFQKTDHIWVDTDIVLLRDFQPRQNENVLGKETGNSICNAVMKLNRDDPHLIELTKRTEAMAGTEIKWGDTGPRLLSKIYGGSINQAALPPNSFYPIHFNDYYKVFLPEYRQECEALCKSSYMLHLWNNRVVKLGIWKKIGPPRDSFLYELFVKQGSNKLFAEFYPEDVMRVMVRNVMFNAGMASTIKKILWLVMPGIMNAVRRRVLGSSSH